MKPKKRGQHVEVVETRVYTLTFEPEDGLTKEQVIALHSQGKLMDAKWQFSETKGVEFLE